MMSRRRSDRSGMATSSRMAATGGIRAARRAGNQAATSVTRMPTAKQTTTVRASIGSDPVIFSPNVPSRALSPVAITAPKPSPTTLEKVPTMKASMRTDRVTWRRDAPSARSRASSRVR